MYIALFGGIIYLIGVSIVDCSRKALNYIICFSYAFDTINLIFTQSTIIL